MGLFERIGAFFRPPQVVDPVFGVLTWMRTGKHPEKSYWEGSWHHPLISAPLSVALPGPREGPFPESREFVLRLADAERLDAVVRVARPRLEAAFLMWTKRSLDPDLNNDVVVAGFTLEDPRRSPVNWELQFEVLGGEMVLIVVPMVGNEPQEAYVDT